MKLNGWSFVPILLFVTSCTLFTPKLKLPSKSDVVSNYAEVVWLSYGQTLLRAEQMKQAIDSLVDKPSPAAFEAAKQRWLDARLAYGQTEPFRFYNGPIDQADSGPEGRINAWPLDEAYIDYVDGKPDAGIINASAMELTRENLMALNEGAKGDLFQIGPDFAADKAIALGWHAIEFLLWGQDRNEEGPGTRTWTDYVDSAQGPGIGAARRRAYLKAVTDLLVDDLRAVHQAWAPAVPGNYREQFVAAPVDESIRKILTGLAVLAKAETGGERMDVALDTLDQEDEHSCFSDNSHNDFLANIRGIANVWYGRYEWHEGPSLDDLLKVENPEQAKVMNQNLARAFQQIATFPVPFDQAIRVKDNPSWKFVNDTVNLMYVIGDDFVRAGTVLGIQTVSAELPK